MILAFAEVTALLACIIDQILTIFYFSESMNIEYITIKTKLINNIVSKTIDHDPDWPNLIDYFNN